MGTVSDAAGNALVIDGLWGLQFGNGKDGQFTNALYFTSGPNHEADGLYGRVTAPEPSSICIAGFGACLLVGMRLRGRRASSRVVKMRRAGRDRAWLFGTLRLLPRVARPVLGTGRAIFVLVERGAPRAVMLSWWPSMDSAAIYAAVRLGSGWRWWSRIMGLVASAVVA